ncbi:MAG: zinc-dependent alcohol dehydrogenase family protein [Planctomycetaceae bacterium]|nr:zinc-dependent alcohol dehydrogenase family protein [Planctomycetaceae bacterium]
MKAAVFEQYQTALQIRDVAVPSPGPDGVIIRVAACGICRSDWHGWMGHDSDVQLPHVPGHELAGVIHTTGSAVTRWKPGDRVTVPFCCGCGICSQCESGHQHICDQYTQPGFTQWGAFAEFVLIRHADVNLVALPPSIDFVTAASLGCRFATSFRAVVHQGRTKPGDWVAIHGCGGVGLSAVMIASAMGARVIAIDVQQSRLQMARSCGAEELIDSTKHDVVQRVRSITGAGANVSIDAFGSRQTCWNSVRSLAKRGRHVQVGLMLGEESDPPIPMSAVIANELELLGSHGMQSYEYGRMLGMITSGQLAPQKLISDTVTLEQGAVMLTQLDKFPGQGVSVIVFP